MAESTGATEPTATATATISVKFTSSDKPAGQVSIPLESTVGTLKETIRSQFDVEPKRIIFQGRILNKDNQTLEECKLKDGLTVVVQAAQAGASAAGASHNVAGTTATAPTSSTAASNVAPAIPAQATPGLGSGTGMGAGLEGGAMGQALATVRRQPAGVARECLTTLTKVIDNIVAHPTEEKYRKIKRANAGFSRKVGGVPGGEDCMRALGFIESGEARESWLLTPSAAAWDVLNAGRSQVQSSLAALPANPSAPAAAGGMGAGSPSGGFAGGLGVLPPRGAFPQAGGYGGGGMGMGGAGAGMPDLASMARMAQDPAIMQNMMNDPSVQAMMRSNPQMAAAMQSVMSSPGGLARAFDMIQNNPGMAQMAQQMMQNPAALQRASQMDLGGAFSAGLNAASNPGQGFQAPSAGVGGQGGVPPTPSPGAAAAATPPPPAATPSTPAAGGAAEQGEGEGKEEKTEDELIAEAIRRSMQD